MEFNIFSPPLSFAPHIQQTYHQVLSTLLSKYLSDMSRLPLLSNLIISSCHCNSSPFLTQVFLTVVSVHKSDESFYSRVLQRLPLHIACSENHLAGHPSPFTFFPPPLISSCITCHSPYLLVPCSDNVKSLVDPPAHNFLYDSMPSHLLLPPLRMSSSLPHK